MVYAAQVVSAAPQTVGVASQASPAVEAATQAGACAQHAWAAPPTLPMVHFHVAQAAWWVLPALRPVQQAILVNPRLPASKTGSGVQ